MHEGDNGQKHPLLTAYNSTVYRKAFEKVNCQNVLWQETKMGKASVVWEDWGNNYQRQQEYDVVNLFGRR